MNDFINRDEAIRATDGELTITGEENMAAVAEYITGVVEKLKGLPGQTERKPGRWIWDDEGYHCSECFFHAYGCTLECMDGTYGFCPHCGSKMKGDSDD